MPCATMQTIATAIAYVTRVFRYPPNVNMALG